MPEGYVGGKPDVNWWLSQIKRGEDFRKKSSYERHWPSWRSYYRGDWSGDVMPVNLFFLIMRTLIPRVYFRNPSVSITPDKPGYDTAAFALVLERVTNKLIRQMGLKKEMKRVIQNTFLFGTGFLKVGFGGFMLPTPSLTDRDQSLGPRGTRLEYRDNVVAGRPWAARVATNAVVYPEGTVDIENSRWVAEWVVRPLEDLQEDKRFKNTKDLTSSAFVDKNQFGTTMSADSMRSIRQVGVYEIRDKKTGKVFVLAPDRSNHNGVELFSGDDELQFNGFPYFDLIFNEDDERCWGLPDSRILEPYQREINEIRTQLMKHRRISLVKILAQNGRLTPNEALKLVSEDVSPVVWVNGEPSTSVMWTSGNNIPTDLQMAMEGIMNDVRETVGFSRNQMGEFQPASSRTSATEANIVRQASEIRVDERRDMTADLLTHVIELVHSIIFRFWKTEEVVELVGPGGAPVWVRFSGELLKTGKYNIKIDPDSSVPETRGTREVRAKELYEMLKTNPLIDPIKLTQYLLHELHGTAFDDMMRGMEIPENMPNGPIQAPQFADLLSTSVRQMQAPGKRNEIADRFARAAQGGQAANV